MMIHLEAAQSRLQSGYLGGAELSKKAFQDSSMSARQPSPRLVEDLLFDRIMKDVAEYR